MEWNYAPALVMAAIIAGLWSSIAFGEWLEDRFNIDAFLGSVALALLFGSIVIGFVVPA